MQRTRTRLRAGANANGGWPQGLNPTLIIDFVPSSALDAYTLDLTFVQPLSEYNATGSLALDFVNVSFSSAPPSVPTYAAHVPDPTTGGITNFQVWN